MRAITVVALSTALAISAPLAAHELRAQDSLKVERPTSELITREQIAEVKASNLRDVVEQLHSNWLIARMPAPTNRANTKSDSSGRAQYVTDPLPSGKSVLGENGGIQVYLDGSRMGGIDELKNIRPAEIYSVRRISGVDAQARFGIGHGAGVLFVSTVTNARNKP